MGVRRIGCVIGNDNDPRKLWWGRPLKSRSNLAQLCAKTSLVGMGGNLFETPRNEGHPHPQGHHTVLCSCEFLHSSSYDSSLSEPGAISSFWLPTRLNAYCHGDTCHLYHCAGLPSVGAISVPMDIPENQGNYGLSFIWTSPMTQSFPRVVKDQTPAETVR